MKHIWYKVVLFSFTLFFLQIADAVISYWAPNEIERNFLNPAAMVFIYSKVGEMGTFGILGGFVMERLGMLLLKRDKT